MPDSMLPPGPGPVLPHPRLHRFPAAGSPTLIFLHGAGCGAWVWEDFAAYCAKAGFPALTLDFARESHGRPAGLSDYLAQVREVLAHLERPVVLVGHSLGALMAQRLLLDRKVRGAALLAPVAPEGLWYSNAHLALTDPVLWAEAARMDAPPGSAPPELAAALFSPSMPLKAGRAALARMGGESRLALLEAQAPQPVPVGWLHGRHILVLGAGADRLIPPDAVRRCALWHGTTASFMPEMGHVMMLEPGWEVVADQVLRWVRGL